MIWKLVCVSAVLFFSVAKSYHVVVMYDDLANKFHLHEMTENDPPPPPGWIVNAKFENQVVYNGWAMANITTNPEYNETFQHYAAGWVEGFITTEMISQGWNNTLRGFCDDPKPSESCQKLSDFITDNIAWMMVQIKENPDDKFWQQVHYGLAQVQGLEDGYNNIQDYDPAIRLKPFGFLLFQMGGDLEDLETALNSTEHLHERVLGAGSCSALIKMVDNKGKKDILVAQDTWNEYGSMLRIMKRYTFGSYSVAFSSYPGYIFSGDDFYILSSGMVVMETTNGNLNNDLWKYVTTDTVPDWLRNLAANRLAVNGEDWCKTFSKYNSGTYNNQFMVLDYKKFEQSDSSGLLYVLEQLPGKITYKDVTSVLLSQTYWASYNIPYFEDIFKAAGFPAMVKKFGDWFTHDKAPRAQIFARDHKKVTDMDSMIKLMRYNDFKNDPLSKCNCTPPYSAENAIAARSDLNPADGVYPFPALGQRNHGATDVKVTSYNLHKELGMMAESGPTHDQQPVFEWDKSPFADIPHEGMPNRYDFSPVLFVWGK